MTTNFRVRRTRAFRLDVSLLGTECKHGPGATIVSVGTETQAFSFFLRDVNDQSPILIPEYGVAVTTADDLRSCSDLGQAILSRGLRTRLQQIEDEPEESFAQAAQNTRSLSCPTWLGMGRDMRIFAIGERLEWVQPQFHGFEVSLPETGDKPCRYDFQLGRGWGPTDKIERSLEAGVLPILKGTLVDDDIRYDLTTFRLAGGGNSSAARYTFLGGRWTWSRPHVHRGTAAPV